MSSRNALYAGSEERRTKISRATLIDGRDVTIALTQDEHAYVQRSSGHWRSARWKS